MVLDRAIGALCVGGVALAASIGLVAGSSTPPPPAHLSSSAADVLGPVDDPATIEAFLEMNSRSERVPRVLDAEWERRNDGMETLTSTWNEVRDATGNHLIAAFGNLDGVYNGAAIFCGAIAPADEDSSATAEESVPERDDPAPDEAASDEPDPDEPDPDEAASVEPGPDSTIGENPLDELLRAEGFTGCRTGPAPDGEAELAQSRVALASILDPMSGTYTVQRAPQRRLAGVDADCFVLRRRGEAGWTFGAETTVCWSPETIPLLVERREGTVVDTRRTTSIRTDVTDADFEALLEPWQDDLVAADVRSAP